MLYGTVIRFTYVLQQNTTQIKNAISTGEVQVSDPDVVQLLCYSISTRHRWEDNIKLDLREIGFGDVDWIHLAQDRDRLL
jgi:hypothetical protein